MGEKVFAVTALNGHGACLSSVQSSSAADQSHATYPSSAGTYAMREERQFRSMTAEQLAYKLRARFDANGRRWRLKDCRAEIMLLDPGAGGLSGHVLRKLKGLDALSIDAEQELIQGLVSHLRKQGFGVCLHIVSAEVVRAQVVDLARKKFYAYAKKMGKTNVRFDTKNQSLLDAVSKLAETTVDVDGNTVEASYLIGWTLIPLNMMDGGWQHFPPVSALDCAGMRGRGQGILVVRATKDADNHIHPVAISHFLGPEGDITVGSHVESEKKCIDLDRDGTHLAIIDGGSSLGKYSPNHFRCSRHLEEQLRHTPSGRASIEIYKKLLYIPKNFKPLADREYDKLPTNSPLRGLEKRHFVQAHLPPNLCHHGNTTNNMAEIFNGMALSVREQPTLYRSLLATVELLSYRRKALLPNLHRLKCVSLRNEAERANTTSMEAEIASTEWSSTAVVPYVDHEHDALAEKSAFLSRPERWMHT